VGGSSKRDVQVMSWVDEVEHDLEPVSGPSWVLWGSSILREMSNQTFGVTPQDPALASDPSVRDEDRWEDMNRYMAVPNWDYLVDTIHKVERSTTGEILVYFTSCVVII
jgi:ATP-dependent phosphoenolpyruvate carboxykinase